MSTLVAANSHAPLVVPLMKNMARERSCTHMYFKHGTYSLCVIHQGCLVPVGVTPQSSSSSQQLSDWIWHWSIISLFFEWSGRGKEKERDMRRQTSREKLEGEREKELVRNQISTTEHVITGKGECNDNHSPLARRQPCIQRIEWDIGPVSP